MTGRELMTFVIALFGFGPWPVALPGRFPRTSLGLLPQYTRMTLKSEALREPSAVFLAQIITFRGAEVHIYLDSFKSLEVLRF